MFVMMWLPEVLSNWLFYVCCGLTSICLQPHFLQFSSLSSNCANLEHQRGVVDVLSVPLALAFCFHQVLSRCVHMMCSCDGGTDVCWVEALRWKSGFHPSSSALLVSLAFLLVAGVSTQKRRRLLNFFLSPTETSPPFILPPRAVFVYDLASGWAASWGKPNKAIWFLRPLLCPRAKQQTRGKPPSPGPSPSPSAALLHIFAPLACPCHKNSLVVDLNLLKQACSDRG